MAFSVRRLPFPDALANVPCQIAIYTEGVNEDGGPAAGAEYAGMCIFSEHAKRVIDNDGKAITLTGKAIIKGDIAPGLSSVSDGVFYVYDRQYQIHAGHRPRNPDGTVHHTELELL